MVKRNSHLSGSWNGIPGHMASASVHSAISMPLAQPILTARTINPKLTFSLAFEAALGEREFFTIYGCDYPTPDGTCVRDYVHVLDIAQAHILALQTMNSPRFSVYNIGTGEGYSVRDVHAHAERIIGTRIPIRDGASRPGDPAVLCASPRRLISELGWHPRHSNLGEIIKTAWAWKERSGVINDESMEARMQ